MKLKIYIISIVIFVLSPAAYAASGDWYKTYVSAMCKECPNCCYTGKIQRPVFSKFEISLLEVARTQCKNARAEKVDTELLKDLLSIEKHLSVPDKYRGAVLAAACKESGYQTDVKGDQGKAIGILQLWPWWESRFKVNRRDPLASASAWISQILKSVSKAERKCGKRSAFVRAWAWVASGPKGWKCRAPRHYTKLKKWHRAVRKELLLNTRK
jgi:hypothetical protein